MKDLNTATKEELLSFLNSFKKVFCDIDGVLMLTLTVIPGSDQCINHLKKLGKTVIYITNKSTKTPKLILEQLKPFKVDARDLYTPIKAIVSHLEKIKYDKKKSLFVIGCPALKDTLKENGYDLMKLEPSFIIDESLSEMAGACLEAKEAASKIGGVIVDFDFNFTQLNGTRAVVLLRANQDLLFLSGLSDHVLCLDEDLLVPGAGHYIEAIERITKRKSVVLAKPGAEFGKLCNQVYGVNDSQDVLFIGDSINTDMKFATKQGYQKLLVLSGVTSEENLENWPASEDVKPQYYVKSLDDINVLLKKFDLIADTHRSS